MTAMKIPYDNDFERDAEGIKCPCGGYAGQVDPTKAEMREYGCGRMSGCCSRAFVCAVCGTRLVGSAPAPEME